MDTRKLINFFMIVFFLIFTVLSYMVFIGREKFFDMIEPKIGMVVSLILFFILLFLNLFFKIHKVIRKR